MNVYDFDKTIYKGDSTLDFYLFCLKKQPTLILLFPIQILSFVLYKLRIYSKLKFKEEFYIFLRYLRNKEQKLDEFWEINELKIKAWYLKQQKIDDIIISASPEFLLKPICERLGNINLIASVVDIETGRCLSENCYGEEKTRRYCEKYGDTAIDRFYSDSITDTPLAKMANESYGVKGDLIFPWSEFEMVNNNQSIQKEFSLFIIIGIINTINGIAFATLFSFILDSSVAFVLGYTCSLVISYVLNSSIVFKNKLSMLKFVKFCISYIPNFFIQFIMVLIFLKYFYLNEFVVYTMSAIIGVPITFLMVKFFALKK